MKVGSGFYILSAHPPHPPPTRTIKAMARWWDSTHMYRHHPKPLLALGLSLGGSLLTMWDGCVTEAFEAFADPRSPACCLLTPFSPSICQLPIFLLSPCFGLSTALSPLRPESCHTLRIRYLSCCYDKRPKRSKSEETASALQSLSEHISSWWGGHGSGSFATSWFMRTSGAGL